MRTLVPLADRSVYPIDKFPVAQWDYQMFYRENFAIAEAGFETNAGATVRALFRAGNPAGKGKPARTAFVSANRGYFGLGNSAAPDLPRDGAVLGEEDEHRYVAALKHNGFFGPCSWYMNWKANIAYAEQAKANWRLNMPALFLHAAYDYSADPRLASRRADARALRELDRSYDPFRRLDGAREAGRGQCGAGEMGRFAVFRAVGGLDSFVPLLDPSVDRLGEDRELSADE